MRRRRARLLRRALREPHQRFVGSGPGGSRTTKALAAVLLRASPDGWPIWALVSHLAGTRVYWLCGVFQEPGAETTAFPDPFDKCWEDQPDHPRSSAELQFAVESSWRIVESPFSGIPASRC